MSTRKFTMEDVKIAHSLKPYLPEEKFLKQFAFLNLKITQGWNMNKIVQLYDKMHTDDKTVN